MLKTENISSAICLIISLSSVRRKIIRPFSLNIEENQSFCNIDVMEIKEYFISGDYDEVSNDMNNW